MRNHVTKFTLSVTLTAFLLQTASVSAEEKAGAQDKLLREAQTDVSRQVSMQELNERIEALESSSPYMAPWPGFEFHGYVRAGYGVDGKGNVQEAFKAPLAGAKYRLGNETETYLEAAFRQNFQPKNADTLFYTQIRFAYVTPLENNNTFDTSTSLREAFAVADNVVDALPGARFWAGERFYGRWDIHLNDFYYRDMSGYGGGVEDIDFVGDSLLALAWIGGAVDELTSDGTPAPADDYRFNKNSIDIRWYDLNAPGGKMQFTATVSSFKQDGFNSGDEVSVEVLDSVGWAAGAFHQSQLTDDARNIVSIQYGKGAAENFRAVLTPPEGVDLASVEIIDPDQQSRLLITEDFIIDHWGPLSMQVGGVVQLLDNGQSQENEILWTSLGARPVYHFTEHLACAFEAGWDYTDRQDAESGSLYKFTLAPEIRAGTRHLDRPSLRAFVTYAFWDDAFAGLVAPKSFGDDTEGMSAGVQLETWW